MYQAIAVGTSEVLIRVYFRGAGESTQPSIVDFERRPSVRGAKEGGLSFFRPSLITYRQMIIKTEKRDAKLDRGLEYIQAQTVRELGFQFYGDPTKPEHICVHCNHCNKNESACACNIGACPLDTSEPEDNDELREELAAQSSVLFEAKPTAEILRIFGADVEESNITSANSTYVDRWTREKYFNLSL